MGAARSDLSTSCRPLTRKGDKKLPVRKGRSLDDADSGIDSPVKDISPVTRSSSVLADEPRKSRKSFKQRNLAIVTRYENNEDPQALNSDLDAQDMPQDHISRLQVNKEGGTFVDNLPKVPMTIDIPAGAVRTQTNIAIIQSFNRRFMPMVDDNEHILCPLIHFCPHQLRLEKAMTVTLRLPLMNPSKSYHVLYSPTDIGDECEWIDLTEPGHSLAEVASQVNANAKEVVLSLLHCCVFIVTEMATNEHMIKFCKLQASLSHYSPNDMVQVDVKVFPDNTDAVMTEVDVRQPFCLWNNRGPLQLTVETSLLPPAGNSLVPVTPHSVVLPFLSVWMNRNPSATFQFQLQRSSQVQNVILVCRVLAQQQEGGNDAVTLNLSRELLQMANVRMAGDVPQPVASPPDADFNATPARNSEPDTRITEAEFEEYLERCFPNARTSNFEHQ